MTFDVPRLPRAQKLADPPRVQRQLKPSFRSNGATGDDTRFRLHDTTADAVSGRAKARAPAPVATDTTTEAVAGGAAGADADAQWDAAARAFKATAAAFVGARMADHPYAGMSAAELLEAAGDVRGSNGSDEAAPEHVRRIIRAALGAGVDALDRDQIEQALVEATGFGKRVIQQQWKAVAKHAERAAAGGHDTDASPDEPKPFWEMSGEEKAAEAEAVEPLCAHLLAETDLLALAERHAAAAGLVGERRILRGVLLAGVARLFPNPLSIGCKGSSSSGKSFTLGIALRFLPPWALHQLAAASPKAMIYLPRTALKHRLVVLTEAVPLQQDEADTFSYCIRTLQSEGTLDYNYVAKAASGKLETLHVRVDGPIGLVTTTTAAGLHAENETRMLTLHTDDGAAQTERVIVANATVAGDPTLAAVQRGQIFDTWHTLYRWIEMHPMDVAIPFARALAPLLPRTGPRSRRDAVQLWSLIKAHALLHQRHRQRDPVTGAVVAELRDYTAVVPLMATTMAGDGGDLPTPGERPVWAAVRRLVEAEVRRDLPDLDKMSADDREGALLGARVLVSVRRLAATIGRDHSGTAKHVRNLAEKGWLVRENAHPGTTQRLGVGVMALPDDAEAASEGHFPTEAQIEELVAIGLG